MSEISWFIMCWKPRRGQGMFKAAPFAQEGFAGCRQQGAADTPGCVQGQLLQPWPALVQERGEGLSLLHVHNDGAGQCLSSLH